MPKCPICQLSLVAERDAGEKALLNCRRCGEFFLTRSARCDLASTLRKRPDAVSLVSHFVRKRQLSQRQPMITSGWVHQVVEQEALPVPSERVGNLVMALGSAKGDAGEYQEISPDAFMAAAGATSVDSFNFLTRYLEAEGLVEGAWRDWKSENATYAKGMFRGRLTMKGWERYTELRRQSGTGTRAFIAMRFGDPELDSVLRDHFRPAVERTGFDLFRLDDEPRAGLIDDRLRVEIKQSRFLLSDLTHANNGAYWEAGYAEGLGKPVIYLCKKSVFGDPKSRPHFDTNHHLTITWDQATIADDMERLVATIRYSIPEARQVDAV